MKYQSKQPKEPMQTHDVPLLPWQTVGSNILEHKNQNYLVVIDYYSKYIEALQLKGEVSQDVIISMLIGVACKSQQSFPLIASQMALQKRLYTLSKTCLRKGGNLNEGLMEYRNTPISNFPYSPNQMLFSRQVRTQVPVHRIMLVPQVCKDVH